MSVPFYPFHSLPFKLLNKGMNFPFLPLKLPFKRREEYSKIILFIPFYSIPFSPPKQGRKAFLVTKGREEIFLLFISNFNLNFCLSSFFKSSFIYRSSEPWPALKSNFGCEKLTLVILSLEDTIHFSWIVTFCYVMQVLLCRSFLSFLFLP